MRALNLLDPAYSDSFNCLADVEEDAGLDVYKRQGMVREQTIVNTGYGYKIHLEAIPIPAAEEYEEDEYGRT